MPFGTGIPSQKFGQFFLCAIKGERLLSANVPYTRDINFIKNGYIIYHFECKFYTDLKIQKNLCIKINI